MENKGLISIIMPSYNTGRFIEETINSVLAQTYKYWELIIVDDYSTDNTDEIIGKYITDKRIKYLKNKINLGAALSRNRALKEATGKWIAFLDSDDLWFPQKLEEQIEFMIENNYHFTYTNYIEIDEDSKDMGIEVSGPKRISKIGMYNYCWIGCLTVMYDRHKVGLIEITDISKNNDYAIWLKVIKKTDCYLLDEVLGKYRRREGSISRHNKLKLLKWHYKLFRDVENVNVLIACTLTINNLLYGIIKKIRYRKTNK